MASLVVCPLCHESFEGAGTFDRHLCRGVVGHSLKGRGKQPLWNPFSILLGISMMLGLGLLGLRWSGWAISEENVSAYLTFAIPILWIIAGLLCFLVDSEDQPSEWLPDILRFQFQVSQRGRLLSGGALCVGGVFFILGRLFHWFG